jgi:antirestriction protein ArdC
VGSLHGTTVVYADRFIPKDVRERARETGEITRAIPFLKRFTVFNAEQCEGLPEGIAAIAPPLLALTNVAVERQRLPEGKPTLR